MAEPASDEASASSRPANTNSASDAHRGTPPRTQPALQQEVRTSGFQAVNSRLFAQNASTSAKTITPESKASRPTPPPKAAAVAQNSPQPAQTSSHSTQPSKSTSNGDGLDGAMSADGATYGTRSRNRTGNARPNYAEDQDMDFEHSAGTSKKKAAALGDSAAQQNGTESKRAREFAQLIGGNGSATPSSANGGTGKESTPVAAPNPSKKRKAAGPPSTLTQTPPATHSPAPGASQKLTAPSAMARETNVMSFTKHKSCLNKKGELIADDGTKLSANDHVYLVCEPPGDPYYLCRIMEFLHVNSEDPTSPVDALRVNWYYRPRDIRRFNSDSRLLYATMHSDICPLTSLRGKCTIKHRSEIEDLEAYRKERDAFYFVQVFDRFISRQYECIPVAQIINVPEKVKKALDERWKFVVVEIGRVKELTSAVKTCKRCTKYCASHDSVDCAICKNSYHMNCVQPPLPKKPSRGFAWACGPCSRASEKKLEQRNTPNLSGDVTEAEEEEILEEEQPSASNDSTRAPSPSGGDTTVDDHPPTEDEIAMAKMWPMRYLGIHARVEDALQYDDRAIYPRASSRLGPRHQANVPMWHGRPVELVKAAEIKKRYTKNNSHKKDGKLTKETLAALEADREEKAKRPKWVQDEPPGYVARGEDYDNDDPRNTAKLLFKIPEESKQGSDGITPEQDEAIETYLKKAKSMAKDIGVPPFGVNFIDKALELLTACNFDQEAALKRLSKVHRVKDLHEPVLNKQELLKFEEGVAKYGSEHRLVRLHMKTNLPHADIVRFYYLWKKTPKGREIWGNYGGRKGGSRRRMENDAGALVQQSVAHDVDDSAFDNDKAAKRNKGFQCKFCNTTHSRQWRRAPGVSPGQTVTADGKSGKEKGTKLLLALCLRCAGLWRKYAIQWEDIEEVAKKVAQGGGRAWKRKIDEELLRELMAANGAAEAAPPPETPTVAVPSIETTAEPPKKKNKIEPPKEKPPPPPKEPTPPPPPIIPNQPTWKVLPCTVCKGMEDTIACAHCKLTVHRSCFGLSPNEGIKNDGAVYWVCEQCQNDRNPQVSTDYSCCLCLTEETLIDLVEPPKVSHKKKTDREREKERMEKELADAMRLDYRNKQLSHHRPTSPREPLKRTAGNNWVHVYCAVWTPEIRFSDAKKLEVAEGFQQIPHARHEALCKLCKNRDHQNRFRDDKGACVSCFQCNANFHVSCAFEAGYIFGFDVTPVKGSRKDQVTTATLADETGSVTAGIWCKEHVVKSIVHPLNEIAYAESGKTALQVFVEKYKQADLTLTGTVRKANMAQMTKEKGQQAATPTTNSSRRESTVNSISAAVRRGGRNSLAGDIKTEGEYSGLPLTDEPESTSERRCVKCKVDVTPRWHLLERPPPPKEPTPPSSPPRTAVPPNDHVSQPQEQINGQQQVNGFGHPPIPDEPPRQNIQFMPPGASGRSWQGRADQPPHPDGPPHLHDPAGIFPRDSAPAANGDGFPNHGMPPHHDPMVIDQPPQKNAPLVVLPPVDEYLCHKCFLKKKLDPTPPPEESLSPAVPPPLQSPHGQHPQPMHMGWNGPGPQVHPSIFDHPSGPPPRASWEEPPREHQPPPPPNGLGLSTYGHPSHPPPPVQNYPPYAAPPPPNSFHGPPSTGHPGPPHVSPPYAAVPVPQQPPQAATHERHPSFGSYGGPPPPPNPPPPHQYPHHRPSPLHFPPPGQPMPNGLASPRHGQHPPMPSPTHLQGPQHYQSYPPPPPRSNDSPFPPHMGAPVGAPPYSSPQVQRPEIATSQPQQYKPGPPYAGPAPGHYPPPPQQQPGTGTPQQQTPQQQAPQPYYAQLPPQPQPSPQVAQSRPQSQNGGRAATPGPAEGTPAPNGIGASASPSLRNLLS